MTARVATALAAALLALVALPAVARGDFGLVPGSVEVTALDVADQPENRAGARPDRLVTSFEFTTTPGGQADGNAKDVMIDLPAGFVGDPQATPRCGRAQFSQGACPLDSQVGVMTAEFPGFGELPLEIYNIVPGSDGVAEFGFIAIVVPIRLIVRLRADGDYGMRIEIRDLPQELPIQSAKIELWGVPADHQAVPGTPRKPLLTNPTSCNQAPPTGVLRVRSWQQPNRWVVAPAPTGQPLVGCQSLAFGPSFDLALTRTAADAPTGARIDLKLSQNDDPDGLATSQLRAATVTLPAGLTLSPGVADGLTTCGDERLFVGSAQEPACPASSKIGTVELVSPVLPDALPGEVYLGRPQPGDRYRLFLTARGPGFTLKLRGSLRPDPVDGRLTMVLANLPALPFDRLTLRLKDGARAPLATPQVCGAGVAAAGLSPYSGGAQATAFETVTIDRSPAGTPCPASAPFAPSLVAGVTPAVAGRYSRFSTTVSRADGERTLGRLTLSLPPGLAARLGTVKRCRTAQVTALACPAASRVGSVVVEAGAGPSPFELPGDVYLTGPYRGASLGLALVVRAIAGPFDLGTLVVPATLRIDPFDAHLTIATDPLPRILGGIPLRVRTIGIDVDRPGFMVNPTNCAPRRFVADVRTTAEAAFATTARFALGGCRKLRFAPRISVALTGRRALRQGRPGLEIALRQPGRQANLRSAVVKLPRLLRLDSSALTTLCSRRQGKAGRCPKAARVGSARARTPLLARPLTGSVYVVQPKAGALPELWAIVEGSGMRLVLRGLAARKRGGRIENRLVDLPDVPLSAFRMRLDGGRRGLLSLAGSACDGEREPRLVAPTTLQAQNGARRAATVRIDAPRC